MVNKILYPQHFGIDSIRLGYSQILHIVTSLLLLQPEFLTSANEVSQFLALMEKAASPLKKLENLLGAMTTLSTSVSVVDVSDVSLGICRSHHSPDHLL